MAAARSNLFGPRTRACVAALGAVLVASCSVAPVPMDASERERIAAESHARLFAGQEPIERPLTLYEATARAIKYQAEYRARQMERAVAAGQLDVAQFDLLPKLTANAGYSTRNNDSFGFGFSPSGAIATNPSASTERTHETAGISFTWSILDFGVSYFRAQQLADQSLVAEERGRKAQQNLVQDVRLAWWRTEAAQRLLPQIDALLEEAGQVIERSRIIEARRLLPPLQIATVRRGLLDLEQQISLKRQELVQGRIELAALLNVPPGTEVAVVSPENHGASVLELQTSIDTLEAVALRNRPELAEEAYKARVNESETRKAMLALFPNLNLDFGRSYDSNRFLVNNTWTSTGFGVAFNLVKAFSLPALERSADAQRKLDESRRLAMAMAVMAQTRIASVRYGLLAHEFGVWDQATTDDDKIVGYLNSSLKVGVDTEFELIRAKARFLVSRINRDLLYANLEAALARIYNSVGLDALPEQVESHDTGHLARTLQVRLDQWKRENFVAKAEPAEIPVAIGIIEGVPQKTLPEFRSSLDRILRLSNIRVAESAESAKLLINAAVTLDAPLSGARATRIVAALVDAQSQQVRYSSEFKTTLSEPVDEEQWRVLGEAAAYRVVGPLGRLRAGRPLPAQGLGGTWGGPALRLARAAAGEVRTREPSTPDRADAEPLALRFDLRLTQPSLQSASKAAARE